MAHTKLKNKNILENVEQAFNLSISLILLITFFFARLFSAFFFSLSSSVINSLAFLSISCNNKIILNMFNNGNNWVSLRRVIPENNYIGYTH